MRPTIAKLRDVSQLITKGTTPTTVGHDFVEVGVPFIRAEDICGGFVAIEATKKRISEECHSLFARSQVLPGDLLITIAGSVGRVGLVPPGVVAANCNQAVSIVRIKPGKFDPQYLCYCIASTAVQHQMHRQGTRATITNVSLAQVGDIEVPVHLLPEQRRIVDILSRAEGIVRLRREAEKKAAELIPALFIEMFGDPAVNPKGWPLTTLGASLQIPIRNGISPSKSGRVEGRVLTLSAITRGAFNPLAVKIAHFAALLSDGDEVKSVDFLVCRGNGNPDLVGRGCFPDADMPSVAFPDTAIAVRVLPTTFDRSFIAAVWETSFVRDQIRAAAKTTNGTYKINQSALAAIVLPKPPLDLQRQFAQRIEAIRALQTQQAAATAKAQASFDALLAQAFPA